MRTRIGIVAAVLVLFAGWVAAQSADLKGRVTDRSGNVLPGITVRAISPAIGEKVLATTTDSKGEYRFAEPPSGTYVVAFSLQGFRTVKREGVRVDAKGATVDALMSVDDGDAGGIILIR